MGATQKNIRIGILDDHEMFMHGTAALINDLPRMKVVLMATNIPVLMHKLESKAIDILLLDLSLKPPEQGMMRVDGDEALPLLAEKHPEVKVIILSVHNEAMIKAHMIEQGACAYLCKTCHPEELETTLQQVAEKGCYFSHDVALAVQERMKKQGKAAWHKGNPAGLNEKELECLRHWMKRLTIKESADAMSKSESSVKTYRKAIKAKTKCNTPAELLQWAREQGIVPEE